MIRRSRYRSLSRRGLLLGSATVGAAATLPFSATVAASQERDTIRRQTVAQDQAYAELRSRWWEIIAGADIDETDPDFADAIESIDDSIEASLEQLDRSSDRERVFADLNLTEDSRSAANTYNRLSTMAQGYRTPGSAYVEDPELLADILAGLRDAHDLVYHPGLEHFGNWHHWEISGPQALENTCILLFEHLDAADLADYVDAIDYFVPDPTVMSHPDPYPSTGANRVDLCQVVAIRGLLGETPERLETARDALSDVFEYATEGDGLYPDGSIVQHQNVAYTGTYGNQLLGGLSRLFSLLTGSDWEIDDPNRGIIYDAVDTAFAPVIYDGQMLDFVAGRAVARYGWTNHSGGRSTIHHILRLAEGAPDEETAHRWWSLARGWLERSTYESILSGTNLVQIDMFKQLMADSSITPAPEPVEHTLFAQMDRAVHRRDGWAYAISMCSERIAHYELSTGENVRGWHQGSGMTYLYDQDNGQYADDFWVTVDPYRLPGITVDKLEMPEDFDAAPMRPAPDTSWVGGSVLDGTLAAIGQRLHGLHVYGSDLRGFKSWFCLADVVVALGARIESSTGVAVESVVENRNLHTDGENALVVDGEQQSGDQGWTAEFTDPGWAHLADVAGYVFLQPARVHALRETRTGRWSDIGERGPDDPVSRRFLTLWIDHGVDPDEGAYSYLVAPGLDADGTAELATSHDVRILANEATAQAIEVAGQRLVAGNFFAPGRVESEVVGWVRAHDRCSVMLHAVDDGLEVAVTDPTQHAQSVTVAVGAEFGTWDGDETVQVRTRPSGTHLIVDTSAHDGRTHAGRLTA